MAQKRDAKGARLSAALRENLKRRKAQGRARSAEPAEGASDAERPAEKGAEREIEHGVDARPDAAGSRAPERE